MDGYWVVVIDWVLGFMVVDNFVGIFWWEFDVMDYVVVDWVFGEIEMEFGFIEVFVNNVGI